MRSAGPRDSSRRGARGEVDLLEVRVARRAAAPSRSRRSTRGRRRTGRRRRWPARRGSARRGRRSTRRRRVPAGWPVRRAEHDHRPSVVAHFSTASPTAKMSGIGRAHLVVDADAAARAELEPAISASRSPVGRRWRGSRGPRQPLPGDGDDLERPVRACSKRARPSSSTDVTPSLRRCPPRRGHLGIEWRHDLVGSFSSTVISRPECARFSAISRPMKPPPTTSARRVLAPRPARSTRESVAKSGMLRTANTPVRSTPGERRPDRCGTRREHQHVVRFAPALPALQIAAPRGSSPAPDTSIAVTSVLVCTSMLKRWRNSSGDATRSFRSSSMMLPT